MGQENIFDNYENFQLERMVNDQDKQRKEREKLDNAYEVLKNAGMMMRMDGSEKQLVQEKPKEIKVVTYEGKAKVGRKKIPTDKKKEVLEIIKKIIIGAGAAALVYTTAAVTTDVLMHPEEYPLKEWSDFAGPFERAGDNFQTLANGILGITQDSVDNIRGGR